MTSEFKRYPFVERDSKLGSSSLAPFLPIELIGTKTIKTLAMLDTGATINVLPFGVGESLGEIWDPHGRSLPLVGNLARIETRALAVSVRIGDFPIVSLFFAWAKSDAVPILLGQINFFLEFDACFHRSRSFFEIRPKFESSTTNPD